MEAQLVETAILNIINHQSLIATKAARVCYAARGDGIWNLVFAVHRGPDAGIYGARAAVIGGCAGTSNVLTGQMFNVPVLGTHAHSWIMSFPDGIHCIQDLRQDVPEFLYTSGRHLRCTQIRCSECNPRFEEMRGRRESN